MSQELTLQDYYNLNGILAIELTEYNFTETTINLFVKYKNLKIHIDITNEHKCIYIAYCVKNKPHKYLIIETNTDFLKLKSALTDLEKSMFFIKKKTNIYRT